MLPRNKCDPYLVFMVHPDGPTTLFTDPNVEDDLQPHVFSPLQTLSDCSPPQPRLTNGLQLLPDRHSPGLAQSDTGPVGLPAPQRDPPEEVLPGG